MKSPVYNPLYKLRSRNLRKNQTKHEVLLWSKLRGRRFLGIKFRRQHPVDQYILDFYSEEKKLAIELDGNRHTNSKQKAHDYERTKVLSSLGIKVIRFWDDDVIKDIDGVLEIIKKSIN